MNPSPELPPSMLLQRRLQAAHEIGVSLSDKFFCKQFPGGEIETCPIEERGLTIKREHHTVSNFFGADQIVLDHITYTLDGKSPTAWIDLYKEGSPYAITNQEKQSPTSNWYILFTSKDGPPTIIAKDYLDMADKAAPPDAGPISHESYHRALGVYGGAIAHEIRDEQARQLNNLLDSFALDPKPLVELTSTLQ